MSLLVNDPVHGHIDLHRASLLIMSTPEFQRLNYLSQMGTARRVFPGAHHTRFEHSIGVAHLAGRLIRHLHATQPTLGITAEEMLCVELAALCHDLGHGPFSHLYEDFCRGEGRAVTHEHLSFRILKRVIDKYGLAPQLYTFGLNDAHISMIGEMMWGGPGKAPAGWAWKGPPMGKEFLYEIVSNDATGIDVDKFDYYLRDCRGANISISFDPLRLIRLTKALRVADGKVHLCYALKDYWNVCEVFRTRFILFTRLYTHKTVVAADIVMTHLLRALAKHPCPWPEARGLASGGSGLASGGSGLASGGSGLASGGSGLASGGLAKQGRSILDAAEDLDFYTALTDGVVELARVEPFASDPEVQRWFAAWNGRVFPKLKDEVASSSVVTTVVAEGEDDGDHGSSGGVGDDDGKEEEERAVSTIAYGGKGSDTSPLESVYFYDRVEATVSGREAEAMLGALLNPPYVIYKHRVYAFRG